MRKTEQATQKRADKVIVCACMVALMCLLAGSDFMGAYSLSKIDGIDKKSTCHGAMTLYLHLYNAYLRQVVEVDITATIYQSRFEVTWH